MSIMTEIGTFSVSGQNWIFCSSENNPNKLTRQVYVSRDGGAFVDQWGKVIATADAGEIAAAMADAVAAQAVRVAAAKAAPAKRGIDYRAINSDHNARTEAFRGMRGWVDGAN